MLPHDFPKWQTVYDYYRQWNRSGLWDKILCALNKTYRLKKSRNASPSYAILDIQSVKTRYCGEERGYDGGEKVKGRKRQITVDVLGCLLHVYSHAANLSDTKVACSIVDYLIDKYPSLEAFSGDGGFRGAVVNYVQEVLGKSFDIAIGIKGVGKFIPVPIR